MSSIEEMSQRGLDFLRNVPAPSEDGKSAFWADFEQKSDGSIRTSADASMLGNAMRGEDQSTLPEDFKKAVDKVYHESRKLGFWTSYSPDGPWNRGITNCNVY